MNITKGHSTNIIEEQLIHHFRDAFFTDTYPIIADRSLVTLAAHRAVVKGEEEEVVLEAVRKEFQEMGQLLFSFDSASGGPAIKQLRQKLLMAGIGSMNMEIDEVGNNLSGNIDALGSYLELYDVGKIKQKLTKNTKENTRSEEIEGRTPANLLLFGTPSKLFDGSKTEDEFYSFLETGYARRCFFGYSREHKKNTSITPEQVYDALVDPDVEDYMRETAIKLGSLANILNHNKIINVDKAVSILVIEYRMHCEKLAEGMGEHEDIAKAEMSHRYFKALKLAGVYAFIDGDNEVTKDNYYHAICMVEESGKAFTKLLARDRPYVKLAKYIGSIGKEVTHVDLTEDLPFYKGSVSFKNELMQLAAAYGHKQHIIIKKSTTNGIEFFNGETLQEVDLDNLQVSYSENIADGYQNIQVDWKDLHKLTQEQYLHWINHHSINGHRSEDHMIPGFDLVVLDVDGGVPAEDCKELLKDYKFLIYTTKRHTDHEHRYRVILPMNYHLKLDASDYRMFMKNLFEWVPFNLDAQTTDRSRKWLSHDGDYLYNEGEELLDARLFIPKTSRNDEQKSFIATYQTMTNMERWFVKNSSNGNRNNQLVRYALMLVDLGYDEESIKNSILDMNNKFPDKLSEKEIINTIMVSVSRKIT